MSERIEVNPRICGRRPIIKGPRISVVTILEQLADDESWDSLLNGYPELTRDDIQAALEYARQISMFLSGLPAAHQLTSGEWNRRQLLAGRWSMRNINCDEFFFKKV